MAIGVSALYCSAFRITDVAALHPFPGLSAFQVGENLRIFADWRAALSILLDYELDEVGRVERLPNRPCDALG